MNARRRVAATRLGGLVLGVCLLAIQLPQPVALGIDPDDLHASRGRPLPSPDAPAAAVAFRQLQWKNERGSYPDNAFVEAKAHADAMRAYASARLFSAAGVISSAISAGAGFPSGGVRPLRPAAGISRAGWTWPRPGNVGGRVRSL